MRSASRRRARSAVPAAGAAVLGATRVILFKSWQDNEERSHLDGGPHDAGPAGGAQPVGGSSPICCGRWSSRPSTRFLGAEADALCGAPTASARAERSQPAQRLPRAALGHPRRHASSCHPQAARGQLLPGLAARSPPPGREGADRGGRRPVPGRRLDPPGGEGDPAAGRRAASPRARSRGCAPSSTSWSRPSAPGPWTAARTRFVMLDALVRQGARGRPHRQRLRGARHRRQRATATARSLGLDIVTAEDGAAWLAFLRGLVARGLSACSWSPRDAHAGPRRRHPLHAARRQLATLPHPLHAQPADPRAALHAPRRGHPGAHDLRPGRRRSWSPSSSPAPWPSSRSASRPPPRCSRRPAPTCWPSPPTRRTSGGRSGATTPSSGSTRRSAAAPTSSASSPTAPPSSASSAPCSANNTRMDRSRTPLPLPRRPRRHPPPDRTRRPGGRQRGRLTRHPRGSTLNPRTPLDGTRPGGGVAVERAQ